MGVTSVIKHALSAIRKIQSINPRVTLMWKRRVLSIADDVEGSKVKLLEEVVSSTAAALIDPSHSDASQRNEIFQESDKRLDAIQVWKEAKYIVLLLSSHETPEEGRRRKMEDAGLQDGEVLAEVNELHREPAAEQDIEMVEDVEELYQEPAVEQDFEAGMEVDEMCQEMARGLQRIHDRLPTETNMQVPASQDDRQYARNIPSFNHLQSVIVSVLTKLETMQQKGLIDTNLPVVVFDLEEAEPKEAMRVFISLDYTFADVAIDLGKRYPKIQLPDFWIKKIDEHSHRVICWEYQTPENKVCSIPARNEDPREVDIVTGKNSYYIVVLIDNKGEEMGRAVELPPAEAEESSASIHMTGIFGNTISRILDLKDRATDASREPFNRHKFKPWTNPLYIELV